jgi:PST family polysaccharide transporter
VDNTLNPTATLPRWSDTRLDAFLVRGIVWTSGMKWVSQALTWACTIAVARLLTPADYGLVGMAAVYLQLLTVVNDLGLGAAVVTKHTLTSDQIAQINALSVLLGAAGVLVSCGLAIPVSTFFATPELRWVALTMSLSCVITAVRAVPSALLERELRFKTLATIEAVQAIAGALAILILALFGLGHWALVVGSLLGSVLWTALVLTRSRHAYAWPRLRSLRDALAFSWHLLVSRLSWYAQANSDLLIVGRLFGKDAFGAYAMSFMIASTPTEKITAMVGRVVFPFFAAIQDNPVAVRRYLLSLTRGMALITFPLACGLALVADDFVFAVLGDKWQAAILPLRCLALLALIQSIAPMLPHVLNVMGDSRYAMRVSLVSGVVMPLSFLVGSRWGIAGVALGWVTVFPLTTLPLYWRVFQKLELSTLAYLKVLWPALSGSLLMLGVVALVRQMLPPDASVMARLVLEVLTGGVAYSLVTVTAHREHLKIFGRSIHTLRGATSS